VYFDRAKVVKHNQKLKKKLRDSIIANAVAKQNDIESGGKNKKKAKRAAAQSTPVDVSAAMGAVTSTTLLDNDEPVDESGDASRDQGYCRPRVLILCPFRGTALRIVKGMCDILGENTSISGLEKFESEYSSPEEDGISPISKKPEDWKHLFDQNIDDDFKVRYFFV
jgi:hypothetical protein